MILLLNPFAVTLRYEAPEVRNSLDRDHVRSLVEQFRSWVEAELYIEDTSQG